MKTKLTLALLVITLASFGQKSDGFISSKAYRIQQVSDIENNLKDTTDYTDFFTKENGFIIIMNYENNEAVFSADKGEEQLMFLGGVKTDNGLEEKDSMIYTSEFMARGGDSLQHATVIKIYHKQSFEETGEKIFSFRLIFKDEIWDFIATEVITGKKEI